MQNKKVDQIFFEYNFLKRIVYFSANIRHNVDLNLRNGIIFRL